MTQGYPVVLTDGVPTVSALWPVLATDTPLTSATQYRTMSLNDIVVAASDTVNTESWSQLSISGAEYVMEQYYGPLDGVLIDVNNGVPSLLASGQDGWPVTFDANGIPAVDNSVPKSSGDSVGPDGVRLWLARIFGAR